MVQAKHAVGTVFFVSDGVRHYWKITDVHDAFGRLSYGVVRCSKTGKEYRDTNGFGVDALDAALDMPNNPKAGLVGVDDGREKADIEGGVEEGNRKRRIRFLRQRIEDDGEELRRLVRKRMRRLGIIHG